MKARKTASILMKVMGAAAAVAVLIAAFVFAVHRVAPRPPATDNSTTLEGTVEADEVSVSSKIPGRLRAITIDEGDPVVAGQVIAILESGQIDAKVTQATGTHQAALNKAAEARVAANLQYLACQDQLKAAIAGAAAAKAKLQEAVTGARAQEKEQARANYDAAKARLDAAISGARPQEIEQAQKGVDQAAAAYRAASATYYRFHGLFQEGVIPRQKLDEIEMEYLSSKAAYEGALARLSLVREGPRKEDVRQARAGAAAANAQLSLVREGARRETIDQARAGSDAAIAAVQLARHNLLQARIRSLDAAAAANSAVAAQGGVDEARSYQQDTRILAPATGYVSEKVSYNGETVAAGYPIATIVKRNDFRVKVYADESKFGSLQLGRPITVVIPALPGTTVEGKLARIGQAADFATRKATNEQGSVDVRSVELVIRIPNPPARLRNGMTARVKLNATGGRSR